MPARGIVERDHVARAGASSDFFLCVREACGAVFRGAGRPPRRAYRDL